MNIGNVMRALVTVQAVREDVGRRRPLAVAPRLLARLLAPGTPQAELNEMMGYFQALNRVLPGTDPVIAEFYRYWERVGDPTGLGDHRFSQRTYIREGTRAAILSNAGESVQRAIVAIAEAPVDRSGRRELWEALRATLAAQRDTFSPRARALPPGDPLYGDARTITTILSTIPNAVGGWDSEVINFQGYTMQESEVDARVASAIRQANTPPGSQPAPAPAPAAPAGPGPAPNPVPAPPGRQPVGWDDVPAPTGTRPAPAAPAQPQDGIQVVPDPARRASVQSRQVVGNALRRVKFQSLARVAVSLISRILKVDRVTAVLFVRVLIALIHLISGWERGSNEKVGDGAALSFGATADQLLASIDDDGSSATFGIRTNPEATDLLTNVYADVEASNA